ncbi:MAG: lysophospholipase [Alphaproteobacteria bacterium]
MSAAGRLPVPAWPRAVRCVTRALAALAIVLAAGCAPRLQPLGEAPAPPRLDDQSFRTADGVTLPVRRFLPDGSPKAVIVALHGFNDYSNAFTDPARAWAKDGIATYAYDQRGFGETPHRGLWPGVDILASDAGAFARALRRRYPDTPLYLLGESMGGAVAMTALARDRSIPVDGVILAAPAVWARETMNPFQTGLLWIGAHTVPWLTLTGRGLHVRASDNDEMLRALSRDPLVIKETRVDTIYGLADLMDAAMDAAKDLPVPALVLYGEHDEVIPRDPVIAMLHRLPAQENPRLRVAFYSTGYHMLLRDLHADKVIADVASWIGNAGAPLPSGADAAAHQALAANAR